MDHWDLCHPHHWAMHSAGKRKRPSTEKVSEPQATSKLHPLVQFFRLLTVEWASLQSVITVSYKNSGCTLMQHVVIRLI